MNSLSDYIGMMTKTISDYGNVYVSKFITWVMGVTIGIGGGTVQMLGKAKITPEPVSEVIQQCSKYAPDWLAWTPFIGVCVLALKELCNWYYRHKEYKLKLKQSTPSEDD